MRAKLLHDADGLRTFAVVFDRGDEAKDGLTAFAADHDVTGASLTAIGAFQEAVLAYFDRDDERYLELPVDEQVEVLSLVGDVAVADGAPEVHAHVVVGRRDGSTAGGHLLRGVVWPTLEVVVQETPSYLRKRPDRTTGLALIDLDAST